MFRYAAYDNGIPETGLASSTLASYTVAVTELTDPQPSSSDALTSTGIARAAILVMLGFIFSRVLGLVRDLLIAAQFGEVDEYFFAARFPEAIFLVVAGGALASAFIPTYTDYVNKDDQADTWHLVSSVITIITAILVVVSLLLAVFAIPVVDLISQFDDPQRRLLTVQLMRIMLLTPAIFGVSGLLMGLLNANQRFLLPALAPAMYNAGIIFGAVVLAPSMGIFGLAWGTVLGALMHLLVQLPDVYKLNWTFRPALDFAHKGVREVARLMGPRVLGLAVIQLNFFVNLSLASGMLEGSVSALTRAFIVMLLPQGIIAQSVATAVFPTFAAQVSADKRDEMRTTFGQVLRAILFLAIPATVGLVLLREPIVRLIFEYGSFTAADRQATSWALLFYGMGLVSHSLVEITTRAFYAMHDTRTPVLVGVVTVILNIGLSLLLINYLGDPDSLIRGPFAGLALANTIATTLEAIVLLLLLSPRMGGIDAGRNGVSALRTSIAAAVMGGVLFALFPLMDIVWFPLGILGTVLIGGVVYMAVSWIAGSKEARFFFALISQRLSRFTSSA